MQFFATAYMASMAALIAASPTKHRSPMVLKDIVTPPGWSILDDEPKNRVIKLRIGLKQSSFESLERDLYQVSDPSHARYGQHLSKIDVHKHIEPTKDTLHAVHDWLADHGIPLSSLGYSGAKDWITVNLSLHKIEDMLDATYKTYLHEDGTTLVRTNRWSLPAHLHDHIDTIQPTNSFIRAAPMGRAMRPVHGPSGRFGASPVHHRPSPPSKPPPSQPSLSVAQACNASGITPLCLRTLYGTIDYVPQVPGKNKVGLNDFLGESNNRSDVRIFLETYRPDAVSQADTFEFISINGGTTEQSLNETELENGTDLEGNLDAETIIGIDYPTPLIAYSTGGSPPFNPTFDTPTDTNEPYLDWLEYILAAPESDVAQTISTSYADDELSVPFSYARRVCNEFAQLGARGVSVFFASGDSGVGGDTCVASINGRNVTQFTAEFPPSCPFVTAVGATQQFNPEVVAYDTRNGFVSGGGFSQYFARPSYQNGVVDKYVTSLDGEFAGFYNDKGRGYPDVAAQGQSFITVWNGSQVLLDGTSASTPTFSAVIALVNDALIAAGRPPLGFLNPWLYSGGYKAFNDIVNGSAIGCPDIGSGLGFPAQTSWDAVTGWGTPSFKAILKLLRLS